MQAQTQPEKKKKKKATPHTAAAELTSINPERDGLDHINICGGKTRLGQLLHDEARTPFTHPIYECFESMEGFWHYLKSPDADRDHYRVLYDGSAKARAKQKSADVMVPNFKPHILFATWCKIVQNPELLELFTASVLPFKYYYHYGPNQILLQKVQMLWLINGLEDIRAHIKKHGKDLPYKKPF